MTVDRGKNDREFVIEAYQRYRVSMFRMALSITRSPEDAEDIVADACIMLLRNAHHLKDFDERHLEGYLIASVKNSAITLFRERKRFTHYQNQMDHQYTSWSERSDPDEHLLSECDINNLKKALLKLNETDQVLIRMKYYQKLSDTDIASCLDIKKVSVRSRLCRARKKLLALLKEEAYDEE
ncbi:MAG: RNA polymerase sigma factor [Clostridia bacterium]|nr:RNA polymerase sigma factor [Clostridia bacterium]